MAENQENYSYDYGYHGYDPYWSYSSPAYGGSYAAASSYVYGPDRSDSWSCSSGSGAAFAGTSGWRPPMNRTENSQVLNYKCQFKSPTH